MIFSGICDKIWLFTIIEIIYHFLEFWHTNLQLFHLSKNSLKTTFSHIQSKMMSHIIHVQGGICLYFSFPYLHFSKSLCEKMWFSFKVSKKNQHELATKYHKNSNSIKTFINYFKSEDTVNHMRFLETSDHEGEIVWLS